MEHNHISVRKLTSAAGVTIIRGLKSGSKTNITIDTLSKILDAVGYQIIFILRNGIKKTLKLA